MLRVERRVSLVFRWDLSRLGVRPRVFIVRKFVVSGRNEGRFEYSNSFYKLEISVFIDRDNGNFGVRPCLLLSSDPQLP